MNIGDADLVPDGRKGSFIGVRRAARQELGSDGEPPPTNEAVAQAEQEKVAVCSAATCAVNFALQCSIGNLQHR